MENAHKKLKEAIRKTTKFMLNLEVYSSARIPDWFDQAALSSSHTGLTNKIYESLYNRLKKDLQNEFGDRAANYLTA